MSADRRIHHRLRIEELEARVVPGIAYPTAYDQYLLELVNRARLNPTAEAARYGIDLNEGSPSPTISSSPKQPLAFNLNIIEAAQQHSAWQGSVGYISHVGAGGTMPWDRMAASGYTNYEGAGENIAMCWVGGTQTAAVAYAHELLFVDSDVDGRGHRVNMLRDSYKEIGVGCWFGQINGEDYLIATEDFGWRSGNSFFTGVVYTDDVVDDDFYTPGEGLGGVTITANRHGGGSYVMATWGSGGYSLRVPSGTYDITASGGAFGTATQTDVYIGGENVKVDFTAGTVSRPDLQVTSVDAPATTDQDTYFDVSWTVRNGGAGAATSAWTDGVYLSTDSTITPSDTLIGTLDHTTTLDPSGQYTETISVQINTPGTYYVGVITDAAGRLLEENEGNNTGYDPIQITVRARPTIGSLTDSPDPVPPGGGDLTLTANGVSDLDGTVTQVAFYRDLNGNGVLDVGTDDLLGTDNNSADGWSWTGSTAAIPYGVHRYFAQATDNDGLLSNTASTTGTVGYPDLTLTIDDVDCETPAQVGQDFDISFTEDNSIPIPTGQFHVDFYMSQNTTAGDGDDVFLGRYTETGGLAASGSRSRTQTFTIPDGTAVGSYYVYGLMDAGGDVTELDEGNNEAWTAATEFDVINARVLRASDPIMTFIDGDGDTLRVMYKGDGYAVITDANNERPDLNSTDIARIEIFNSTPLTRLTVQDMDSKNTPNTLTLGTVITGSLKSIQVINRGGRIANTHITVTGDLFKAMLTGNVIDSSLTVTGTSAMFKIAGNMDQTTISAGGDRLKVMVNGKMTNGSIIDVTGATFNLNVKGALNDSVVTAENMTFFRAGSMSGATVTGTTSLVRAYCMGDMAASTFVSNSDTSFFMVRGDVTVAAPGDQPFQVLGGHNLDRLMIMGSVNGAAINIGGDLGFAKISDRKGKSADNMRITIGGNLSKNLFLGTMTTGTIAITGTAKMIFWKGTVTDSDIDVSGSVGTMRVFGAVTGTTVDLLGGVEKNLQFMGQIDSTTINVTGGCNMARLRGMTNSSELTISGDTRMFMCTGAVEGTSSVYIGGTTRSFKISAGLRGGSSVTLDGDVDKGMISGPKDGDSVSWDSTVTLNSSLTKMLMFSGTLQGIVDITGTAAESSISVKGNLTGQLIAAAFGNVSINGSFSGQIGDAGTVAGVDNMLKINTPGGGGALLPDENIFATRMGYP
ncbi:MAG: hypothetical protein GXP25_00495 [Planctomycetes bacterium]|nr:hypothetical protein [Planctomycetota bacterium]